MAIIALIATPIVLGIIKDTKKESDKRSLEGYASALTNVIAKEQLDGSELIIGTFTTENGKELKQDNKIKLTLDYDGNVKCDTIEIYEDGTFYLANCEVNGDEVSYTYGIDSSYENGEVVYFNVKDGVGCEKKEYEGSWDGTDYSNSYTGYNGMNKTSDKQNSCLKFYAFLDDGGNKIKLLLDHNTTERIRWSADYVNTNGPTAILPVLKSSTEKWSDKILEPSTEYGYQIDYTGYKARLITAQEIAQITGADLKINWDETSSTSHYVFDTLTQTTNANCIDNDEKTICKYSWLYDRTNISCEPSCLNNADSSVSINMRGYWTSSVWGTDLWDVWLVNYSGAITHHSVHIAYYGIRPVIEVLKSSI